MLSLVSWCSAQFVSVSVCVCVGLVAPSVFVCIIVLLCVGFGFWEFLLQVGRVRFPGEVGELAPLGGVPYLR